VQAGAIPIAGSGFSVMTVLQLGDLVVLKSGGPVMTVDAINTDIFDDSKFTGVVCVWFVGDKLQRVRFDYRAVELAPSAKPAAQPEAAGDYKDVLDTMTAEMNPPEDAGAAKRVAKAKRSRPRAKPTGQTPVVGTVSQH